MRVFHLGVEHLFFMQHYTVALNCRKMKVATDKRVLTLDIVQTSRPLEGVGFFQDSAIPMFWMSKIHQDRTWISLSCKCFSSKVCEYTIWICIAKIFFCLFQCITNFTVLPRSVTVILRCFGHYKMLRNLEYDWGLRVYYICTKTVLGLKSHKTQWAIILLEIVYRWRSMKIICFSSINKRPIIKSKGVLFVLIISSRELRG